MKRHLLSYLAGVFDGEGCVTIIKTHDIPPRYLHPRYQVCLMVNMTDEAVPRLFQDTFDGSITRCKKRNPKHNTTYTWTMRTHSCLAVLKALLPYVIIKRPQIEVAIHLQEGLYHRGKIPISDEELALREAAYILCKGLKGRGRGVG